MAGKIEMKECVAQSNRIIEFLIKSYRDVNGVHAETIIGACAALCGHFALLAKCPRELAAHPRWILNATVDELLLEGADADGLSISAIVLTVAQKQGAKPTDLPEARQVNKRINAGIGMAPFPPLSVAKEHWPKEWSPNALVRFKAEIAQLANSAHMSNLEMAYSLAIATASLIEQTSEVISPVTSATLALEIIFGTAKMGSMSTEL